MDKLKLYIYVICRNIDRVISTLKNTYGNFLIDVGLLGLMIITLSFTIWFGLILKLIFEFVL